MRDNGMLEPDGRGVSSSFDARIEPGHRGRNLRFPILLVILCSWALRLYRLDTQSFWYDEGHSAYLASLPVAENLEWSASELIPPLHSFVLAIWLPVAGWTEFAARFLSVGEGVMVVAVLVRLGREWDSPLAGLLTGFLSALSPFYVWHSQNARMYMLEALLGTLATLVLFRALRRPRQRALWVSFAVLELGALHSHVTAALLVGFHLVMLAVFGRRSRWRSTWLYAGLSIGGALFGWMPWLASALRHLDENAGYWPGRMSWQFIVSSAFQGVATGSMVDGLAAEASVWVWGGASLLCAAGLWFYSGGRNRRMLIVLLAYFCVPVGLMAWLFRDVPKFSPRYVTVFSPGLFLLVGVGLAVCMRAGRRRRSLSQVTALVVLIGLTATALHGLSSLYFDATVAKADFRTAARMVREHRTAGELVLIVPGHVFPVWQFYFGPTGWAALPDDPLLDVRNVLHYRNTALQLNDLLRGHAGVWLVEWEPWVIDPTDLVIHLLDQAGDDVPLPDEPTGLLLRHYRLKEDPITFSTDPEVEPSGESSLDLPLRLVGCDLPRRVRGDEEIELACFWECWDALPEHLSVSVRLLDTNGVEWGMGDTAITGPYLVSGRWPLGEPVLGRYAVQPAPGIPPGDFYTIALLVYEPDRTGHGGVEAGQVGVARPDSPFSGKPVSGQQAEYSLGGLVLEGVSIYPEMVLPGDVVWVEAMWRVAGPFAEPLLMLEGQGDEFPILPQAGASGLWRMGDRFRTVSRVPVSRFFLGGPTAVWLVSPSARAAIGKVHVDIVRTFVLPADVPAVDYHLGDAVSLVGSQMAIEERDSGRFVQITLYWQANAHIEAAYTVFAHVVGPDGQIHAQVDSWPQGGRHPSTHWLPGEVVADPYTLALDHDAPGGLYQIVVGMYDAATMDRLAVTDGSGESVAGDAILVGELEHR